MSPTSIGDLREPGGGGADGTEQNAFKGKALVGVTTVFDSMQDRRS